MKKNFKFVLALVLAAMMIVSMVPAMAANGSTTTHTITITNSDQVGAHTYEAYQVFAGDYDETSKKLSNITWGKGVNGDAILNAVKAATTTFGADAANATTPEDVAKLLGSGEDTAKAKKFAEIVGANLKTPAVIAGTSTGSGPYSISVTGDGYYFIKDKAPLPTDMDNTDPLKADNETRYILQVVHDVTVAAKSSTVESSKKIDDTNDTTGQVDADKLKDSADYDIGDKIPYTLTAKLPAKYADFEKYYLAFVDDMSAGLTFNNDAKIWYGTVTGTGEDIAFTEDTTATSDYTGGKVYKATIADLKSSKPGLTAGTTITIKYTATLNSNAVIGEDGNPNKSQIEFFNNPNNTGDGAPTGKTPWDTVIAFTYDVEVDKVTGETPVALNGAAFTLYKLFKDDATLTAVNADRAADKQYTKVTEIKYDNGTKNYTIASGEVWAIVEAKAVGTNTNVFNFSGVDDGTYLLVETTTPAGYNSIKPSKFTITAPHTDGVTPAYGDPTATSVDDANHSPISLGEMTRNGKKVGLKTNVVNNEGAVLPSTGGIGTTIFYVAGSILVLAAAILLITKRRMGSND